MQKDINSLICRGFSRSINGVLTEHCVEFMMNLKSICFIADY